MRKNIEFGAKLHDVVVSKGITIGGLAEITKNPTNVVAKWCLGMQQPSEIEMQQIATALKMSKEELKRLLN